MSETPTVETTFLKNLWDAREAAALESKPLELLRYRSNLLGADLRITNFGGGNTSSKFELPDPLTGELRRVMAVKGSGGDLASIGTTGFAILYMDKLEDLIARYRGEEHEDEMVGFYPLCAFGENRVAASIDTALHAFLPFPHVDHLHPDWAIALAASANGKKKLEEFNKKYGRKIVWVPWQRPGFELALMLRKAVGETPGCDGIVLGGHGLFTWGETQHEAYLSSIKTIDQMGEFVQDHAKRAGRPLFGGATANAAAERQALVTGILPALRGAVSSNRRVIAHYDGGEDAMAFANAQWAESLCQMGTSCPDHFLRTRISPLYVPFDAAKDGIPELKARIAERLVKYRQDYAAYYKAHALPDSPALRDSNPSVVVIPGLGLFGFGKDKREARITSEFFVNAIHVMSGANALGAASGDKATSEPPQARHPKQAGDFKSFENYVALPRSEAFRIEYWALEEAKLQRMPPEREFSRKIVVVVGGASGIGREVALQIAKRGGHVVVADMNVGQRAGSGQGSGGRFVEGNGAGDRARSDVARQHRRSVPRDRRPLRWHRRHRQHRGHLSDAAAGNAARSDVGEGHARQRDEQLRPRRRSDEDPEGSGAAGVARAHELGERGRAEVRERTVRRQQGRDQSLDPRAGDGPRTARARQRHRAGDRRRRFGDVPERSRDGVAEEVRDCVRRVGVGGEPARQARRVLRAAHDHAPSDPADRLRERHLLARGRSERQDHGARDPGRWRAAGGVPAGRPRRQLLVPKALHRRGRRDRRD